MFFEEMCSSCCVIWKFIEAQTKKKKSAPQNQAAKDCARLTGARFSLSAAEKLSEHKCWETWTEKSKSKFSYFGFVNVKKNTLL